MIYNTVPYCYISHYSSVCRESCSHTHAPFFIFDITSLNIKGKKITDVLHQQAKMI